MSLSLYIHIPFCMKRCIYCDFVSGVYNQEKADYYIEALTKELRCIPSEVPFSSLYIGGGTPTALSTQLLSELTENIFSNFQFIENYEATIEANPGTVDRDKLSALRLSGMNRISMGVQSFNDRELSFLGRVHSSEEAEEAVYLAGGAGFENIGIDLIYGIPGQDINSWKETLEKAVSLRPGHLSAYELTVEKGTVLDEYCLKDEDEDRIIEMYEYTIDYLVSRGYIHYEISNFARPGRYCRHNLNYWDRGEYFGAGLGAHSFIGGKRYRNTDDLEEYIKAFAKNMHPVKDSEDIDEEKALSEALFLGLRKTGGIIVEDFAKRYRKNILSHYHIELKDLLEAGLVKVTGSDCSYETSLRLTRKGLLVSNEIFTKFI